VQTPSIPTQKDIVTAPNSTTQLPAHQDNGWKKNLTILNLEKDVLENQIALQHLGIEITILEMEKQDT